MCTTFDTPSAVHCALVSQIQDVIRHEMTWFPMIVAHESDVIDVTLDLIPNPNEFDTAEEYLSAAESALDVDGCMLRESIEGLFTGIVYTHDSIEFWREYESECEEAVSEYGLLIDMSEYATVSDVIVRAADYGGMYMLSNKASDICVVIGNVLGEIESELPE